MDVEDLVARQQRLAHQRPVGAQHHRLGRERRDLIRQILQPRRLGHRDPELARPSALPARAARAGPVPSPPGAG